MLDLTGYALRINAKTTGEAFVNGTVELVNSTFESNPSYEKILYNQSESDCLYRLHKYQSNIMYITLRPLTEVNKGDYVEFRGKTYLVDDFTPNDIYPKAEIIHCNNTLRWKDAFGSTFEFPCVLSGNTLVLDDAKYSNSNRFVLRSDSTINAKIAYNDSTKNIYPTQRFIINNKVFDVTTINDLEVVDGKGFLELSLTSTAKSNTDDLDNSIADDSGDSGWSGW